MYMGLVLVLINSSSSIKSHEDLLHPQSPNAEQICFKKLASLKDHLHFRYAFLKIDVKYYRGNKHCFARYYICCASFEKNYLYNSNHGHKAFIPNFVALVTYSFFFFVSMAQSVFVLVYLSSSRSLKYDFTAHPTWHTYSSLMHMSKPSNSP